VQIRRRDDSVQCLILFAQTRSEEIGQLVDLPDTEFPYYLLGKIVSKEQLPAVLEEFPIPRR
jgi:hypothetical protein